MMYCAYYQAHVRPEETWFFTAVLRSYEHLAFDRTLVPKEGLFEFFVPEDLEHYFLEIMQYFEQCHIISNITKLPNRLENPQESLS